MTFFKTITATTLTGLATFGFASASLATPRVGPIAEGSLQAYKSLVDAIRRNGVSLVINDPVCGNRKDVRGFYAGQRRALVVCQVNGTPGGSVVTWTSSDLDTLRHEAQHMIQDCIVGTKHDNQLAPVYNSPSELAQETIGQEAINRITQSYRSSNASDLTLLLEYEAFSVAALNVPLEQAQDITTYCGV